jgi:glycosyltransferase involved in cell wall biosynthesis
MKVAFVSTFLPERCGLATYAARVLPFIEEVVAVQKVQLPYGATFMVRRKVPVLIRPRTDLVHVNYEYALYGQNIIPLLLWLRLRKIPVVLTLHSHNVRNWPNRYLNLWINSLPQKVVVHSQETAQRYGYVHIPHGGPDNPYLRERDRCQGQGPRFIHTGFVRANKRLDEIIKVFCRRPELNLVICGTHHGHTVDSYYRRCQTLFEENRGNITWHDRFMSEDELLKVYAKGDVLVLFHAPVDDNYHSGLVSDALASGLPVIAPPLPGLREQVMPEWGYVMDGFEVADLEKGLEVAKKYHRRWQQNLARVRGKFLWANIASEYIKIYQELVGHEDNGCR